MKAQFTVAVAPIYIDLVVVPEFGLKFIIRLYGFCILVSILIELAEQRFPLKRVIALLGTSLNISFGLTSSFGQ